MERVTLVVAPNTS